MTEKYKDFDDAWQEKEQEGPTFKAYGEEYELPPSPPATLVLSMNRLMKKHGAEANIPDSELLGMATKLLGEDNLDELCDKGMTVDEMADLIQWANSIYFPQKQEQGTGKQ